MRPRKHNPMCPTHGVLKGGALDGQAYAFLRVEEAPDLGAIIHLRLSDGIWPFPRDTAIRQQDLAGVEFWPVPGQRARRFNADEAITAAHVAHYEAATAGIV
jgi:hypothetical protein